MADPDYLNPLSAAFWAGAPANAPGSYAALDTRRRIAAAMLGKRSPFPQNFGQGLTYFGERLGDIAMWKRLQEAEAASDAAGNKFMGGPPAGTSSYEGGSAGPRPRTIAGQPPPSTSPGPARPGPEQPGMGRFNPNLPAVPPGFKVGSEAPDTAAQTADVADVQPAPDIDTGRNKIALAMADQGYPYFNGASEERPAPMPETTSAETDREAVPLPPRRPVFDRSRINAEIEANPALAPRLQTIVQGEVGRGASIDEQRIQAEAAINRAVARGIPLEQALRMYTGPGSSGYYPASTFRNGQIRGPLELANFRRDVLDPVQRGSDTSTPLLGFAATGNASGDVAANGIRRGTYNVANRLPGGSETYVQQERPNQLARLEATRVPTVAMDASADTEPPPEGRIRLASLGQPGVGIGATPSAPLPPGATAQALSNFSSDMLSPMPMIRPAPVGANNPPIQTNIPPAPTTYASSDPLKEPIPPIYQPRPPGPEPKRPDVLPMSGVQEYWLNARRNPLIDPNGPVAKHAEDMYVREENARKALQAQQQADYEKDYAKWLQDTRDYERAPITTAEQIARLQGIEKGRYETSQRAAEEERKRLEIERQKQVIEEGGYKVNQRPTEEERARLGIEQQRQTLKKGEKELGSLTQQQSDALKYLEVAWGAKADIGKGGALAGLVPHTLARIQEPFGTSYGLGDAYRQQYSARAAWVEAMVRDRSGKAINRSEIPMMIREYFAVPGDNEKEINRKNRARTDAEQAMLNSMGNMRHVGEQRIRELEAKAPYRVDPADERIKLGVTTRSQTDPATGQVRRQIASPSGYWEDIP